MRFATEDTFRHFPRRRRRQSSLYIYIYKSNKWLQIPSRRPADFIISSRSAESLLFENNFRSGRKQRKYSNVRWRNTREGEALGVLIFDVYTADVASFQLTLPPLVHREADIIWYNVLCACSRISQGGEGKLFVSRGLRCCDALARVAGLKTLSFTLSYIS